MYIHYKIQYKNIQNRAKITVICEKKLLLKVVSPTALKSQCEILILNFMARKNGEFRYSQVSMTLDLKMSPLLSNVFTQTGPIFKIMATKLCNHTSKDCPASWLVSIRSKASQQHGGCGRTGPD